MISVNRKTNYLVVFKYFSTILIHFDLKSIRDADKQNATCFISQIVSFFLIEMEIFWFSKRSLGKFSEVQLFFYGFFNGFLTKMVKTRRFFELLLLTKFSLVNFGPKTQFSITSFPHFWGKLNWKTETTTNQCAKNVSFSEKLVNFPIFLKFSIKISFSLNTLNLFQIFENIFE